MARPLPRTTETERWYRVPGKRRRPRVIWQPTEGRPDSPSGAKDREAIRGSSPKGDAPKQTSRRRREGTGEGEPAPAEGWRPTDEPGTW